MKHEEMDVIKVYDRRGKSYVVSVYALQAYRASRIGIRNGILIGIRIV
jgi:hypothetical protein